LTPSLSQKKFKLLQGGACIEIGKSRLFAVAVILGGDKSQCQLLHLALFVALCRFS
jgi:hypothetical protein